MQRRTVIGNETANQLIDFLASDGRGGQWAALADLAEWETLYNLNRECQFLVRLARNLAGRGLADIRRAAHGLEIRLTSAGITLAGQRKRQAANAWAMIDVVAWNASLESVPPSRWRADPPP